MSVINTFEMSVIHCPVFTVFLVVNNFIQKYLYNAYTDFA